MKKVFKWIGLAMLLMVVGFYIWAEALVPVMPEAEATMASTDSYEYIDNGYLYYKPIKNDLKISIIIYPGARVEADSYGVIGAKLAEMGYHVYMPRFFADIAFFGINKAETIMAEQAWCDTWYIGGHSLGGVAASNYLAGNLDEFEGLILFASYPAGEDDLSDSGIRCLSIYGEFDGLATVEEIEVNKKLLPIDTAYHMIEGGNHGYFGYYGDQSGDGTATITRQAQQEEIVGVIDEWIKK
ncbi:MAG: hypothetical protein PF505_05795 [Vallitaleaceae bacterium]|jgi:hypothetical protein|nr:hypothetical protein [Vallitaleaceae bacterium]